MIYSPSSSLFSAFSWPFYSGKAGRKKWPENGEVMIFRLAKNSENDPFFEWRKSRDEWILMVGCHAFFLFFLFNSALFLASFKRKDQKWWANFNKNSAHTQRFAQISKNGRKAKEFFGKQLISPSFPTLAENNYISLVWKSRKVL